MKIASECKVRVPKLWSLQFGDAERRSFIAESEKSRVFLGSEEERGKKVEMNGFSLCSLSE